MGVVGGFDVEPGEDVGPGIVGDRVRIDVDPGDPLIAVARFDDRECGVVGAPGVEKIPGQVGRGLEDVQGRGPEGDPGACDRIVLLGRAVHSITAPDVAVERDFHGDRNRRAGAGVPDGVDGRFGGDGELELDCRVVARIVPGNLVWLYGHVSDEVRRGQCGLDEVECLFIGVLGGGGAVCRQDLESVVWAAEQRGTGAFEGCRLEGPWDRGAVVLDGDRGGAGAMRRCGGEVDSGRVARAGGGHEPACDVGEVKVQKA